MNDPSPNWPSAQSAITLTDEQAVMELIGSTVMNLWDAVNGLTRLKPTRRERYRVTIFGSARVPQDH